jgi:hypothetical protein
MNGLSDFLRGKIRQKASATAVASETWCMPTLIIDMNIWVSEHFPRQRDGRLI